MAGHISHSDRISPVLTLRPCSSAYFQHLHAALVVPKIDHTPVNVNHDCKGLRLVATSLLATIAEALCLAGWISRRPIRPGQPKALQTEL